MVALWRNWPAVAVMGAISLLLGGALAALGLAGLSQSGGSSWRASLDLGWRAAGFTLWQASLSTILSLIPALALARALHRHPRLPGRAFLLRLFALPLALPALIAALGILALLGRGGVAAPALTWLTGARWPGIYGLEGILIAHVFFNLPLAARFFLAALEAVPADQWRNARQLGFSAAAQFRLIEWPAMRMALPGAALTVFMLCATSFTLVLLLGGGPQATTLEVAIYQALRFDFDPARAALLALMQLSFALLAAAFALRYGAAHPSGTTAPTGAVQAKAGFGEKAFNAVTISLAALLVALPVLATLWRGLDADIAGLLAQGAVQRAALTSLVIATLSAASALLAAVAILSSGGAGLAARMASVSALSLAVSPVVLGAGWFLALRLVADPFAAAPVAIVLANALMALPFTLRLLAPAWIASRQRHDRLAASIGLAGWTRLRLVEGRALAHVLGAGFALAALLSLGDLGVIALFGSDAVQTLPGLLHARLGSYRTDDAAGLAFLLTLGCLGLLWLAGRLAGRQA
jgi:thiamine transport system permease protein